MRNIAISIERLDIILPVKVDARGNEKEILEAIKAEMEYGDIFDDISIDDCYLRVNDTNSIKTN